MTIRKLRVEQLPGPTARTLNQTTFLGSTGFTELWQAQGGRGVYWCVEEGDKISGVLSSVQFGSGPLARLQAMPDGLYARPVWLSQEIDRRAALKEIMTSVARDGYARAYVTDFYGDLEGCSDFEREPCETPLVDVSSPDWEPPDKKLRSELRKAERESSPPVAFSWNRHLDGFLKLMTDTERRHGRKPKYSEAFYRGLGRLAATDNRIHWYLIEHEGEIAASHIYFTEGDLLLYWQAYYDKAFSFLKPNQYLTYKLVGLLREKGIRTLILGATPPEAEGLADYKRKWGGRTHRYSCLVRKSLLGRVL